MAFSIYIEKLQCEKFPYSDFFWSVFSRIWSEYKELLFKTLYSVWMHENMDQKNSYYGHFLYSVNYQLIKKLLLTKTQLHYQNK